MGQLQKKGDNRMDIDELKTMVEARDFPMEWQADSACRGLDTDIFFTPKPHPIAEEACGSCSVQLNCLAFALRVKDEDAFMGNTTAEQRIEIARLLGRKRRVNGFTKPKPVSDDPLEGTDIKHGTYAGYTHGCKETCCRVAKNAYVATRRYARRAAAQAESDQALSA